MFGMKRKSIRWHMHDGCLQMWIELFGWGIFLDGIKGLNQTWWGEVTKSHKDFVMVQQPGGAGGRCASRSWYVLSRYAGGVPAHCRDRWPLRVHPIWEDVTGIHFSMVQADRRMWQHRQGEHVGECEAELKGSWIPSCTGLKSLSHHVLAVWS